ncbi:hypothetical protein N9L36_01840 [Schleiferiaceae bacterium]|nr:hypothetical protein [Schleiferiaceae bacterium]
MKLYIYSDLFIQPHLEDKISAIYHYSEALKFPKVKKKLVVFIFSDVYRNYSREARDLINKKVEEFARFNKVLLLSDLNQTSSVISFLSDYSNYDFSLGYYAQMPFKKKTLHNIASCILNFVRYEESGAIKCYFIDLDDTLIPGVWEENQDEIVRDYASPKNGNYHSLLSYIKKQSSYGAQIIIVSKNESTSIQSALSFIDPFWDRWVTSIDAGWNAKHLRIQSLVHKMNININDCVFIDDNPIEIQSVKDELRMRNAIQYNGNFSSLMQELNILGLLNAGKGNFINERKNQYQNLLEDKNQKRDKSLNVDYSYELWHNNKDHYDRVMELSSKTNQFNLNKELLTKDSFLKYSLYTWDCRTKFGYLGVIGYAIISSKSELINFVMSCRALGFSLEQEVFNRLLKNINIRSVLFNKTEKNGVAETFINELERSHELKIISKPAIQKID